MAYREVSRVEIAEVVRRWQSGISQRRISTGTGRAVKHDMVASMTMPLGQHPHLQKHVVVLPR